MKDEQKEAVVTAMMDRFDCEKVQAYMAEVNWKWWEHDQPIHGKKSSVPTVEHIQESVEYACLSVMEGESGYFSSGGLVATCTFDTSGEPRTLTLAMMKKRAAEGHVEKAVVTMPLPVENPE